MTDTVQPQSRTWDVMCHLAALSGLIGVPFGHILGPLIVWLIKRGDSPSVDRHGKESLNFQISLTIYGLVASCLTVGLLIASFGLAALPLALFGIPLLMVFFVAELVLVIVAAMRAGDGVEYRYPLTIRLLS
jgi:uncharacterized Tic20 family protein